MQTLTFKVRADTNGIITLQVPTEAADQSFEVVIVLQRLPESAEAALGYPPRYFAETNGSFADDPLIREQLLMPDGRDALLQ
jgi:hypothetical protein